MQIVKERVVVKNKLRKGEIPELSYEAMFKATFAKCPNVLLTMINDILRENFEVKKDKLKIIDRKLGLENIRDKNLECDCVVIINDKYLIDIELNRKYYKGLYSRNFAYLAKLYVSLFTRGMSYLEYAKYKSVQINLNNYHNLNDEVINEQMLCNVGDKMIVSDIIKIIQLDVVKSNNLLYTKDIKEIPKEIRWGAIFKEKTIAGISKILGEDMLSLKTKPKFIL